MFNFNWDSPSEFKGTITLDAKHKNRMRLGPITDVNGNSWDIRGIYGDWVQATPSCNLHPYFNDTSSMNNYGIVQQTWEPYKLEFYESIPKRS